MFKVNNTDTRATPGVFLSDDWSVSIVNFEHVNADWEMKNMMISPYPDTWYAQGSIIYLDNFLNLSMNYQSL